MLLNKMNVLDKGFVALLDSSCNGKLLQDIQNTYFKANINLKLLKLCTATMVIKCPLFVQLNLSQYGFDIISTPSDDVEAYIPDIGEIKGESLTDRQGISDYITQTTEALLMNHKGMPMDGADEFTAQLLTPITVYNEIIVHGDMRQWSEWLNQKKLPDPLESYRSTLNSILLVEWGNLPEIKKILR